MSDMKESKECEFCGTTFTSDLDTKRCLSCEFEREEAYEDAPNDWWDDGSDDIFEQDEYESPGFFFTEDGPHQY